MKLLINNTKYPDFSEFPIERIETYVISPRIKNEYIESEKSDFPNLENYTLTDVYLKKNYTEDEYMNLIGYFTFDKAKFAKIKLNNNKEIMMCFDVMAKISRSDIPGESKISFITFKFKEDIE